MSLLIVYPTRGRQHKFLRAIENIYFTIGTNDFEIIVNADEDDVTMNNDFVKEKIARFTKVKMFFDKSVSKIHACNRNIDKAKPWTWSLLMSDDQWFVQNKWHDKMLAQIKSVWGESTDFFAHFSDGYVKDKLPTMNICGYAYYKRFGYFYYPGYGSVSVDAEAMYVAMMLGKHHYFPEVYFNHQHPGNIPTMSTDATYRYNDRFGESDTRLYFERMAHGFYVENPVFIPDEVKRAMENRPKLSILIPSTNGRKYFNERISYLLEWQRKQLQNPDHVEVLWDIDNGEATIGEKRNRLVKRARGIAMAFCDSDDVVCDGYLQHGINFVASGKDAASLLGLYFSNGVYDRPFHHSDIYEKWDTKERLYERSINHLNFIKTEIAKQIVYEHKSFGEDGVYSEQLKASGLIKSEYTINEVLYLYFARSKQPGE